MNRREVIALAAALVGGSHPAVGQTVSSKYVGVLMQGGDYLAGLDGLREGLKAAGLEEGPQLRLGLGVAENLDIIQSAAKNMEREGANVLVTFATTVSAAAQQATARVPIVFVAGSDPVRFGLVENIARPGGRLTGVASFRTEISAKRLALLRELLPGLKRILIFHNAERPSRVAAMEISRKAAKELGIEVTERRVTSAADIRRKLNELVAGEADAFFFPGDALVISQSQMIIERATSLGMATMAANPGAVSLGALAGYGVDYRAEGRLAAKYVARILAGTPPADLPVEVNERHFLSINLKTAKALGIDVPATLLARADKVIE